MNGGENKLSGTYFLIANIILLIILIFIFAIVIKKTDECILEISKSESKNSNTNEQGNDLISKEKLIEYLSDSYSIVLHDLRNRNLTDNELWIAKESVAESRYEIMDLIKKYEENN